MSVPKLRVEADVHMAIKDGYRLKVSVHGVGMYINGWQMYRSKRHGSGWKSTTPSYTARGKVYHPLEFNKKEQLWKDIDAACIRAVTREEEKNGSHENPFRKVNRPEM